MKWIDYRAKLGIGFNDEQKFQILRNAIINFIDNILSESFTDKSYISYCIMIGEKHYSYGRPFQHLSDSIEACKATAELISKYIAFYNSFIPGYSGYSSYNISKKEILSFLKSSLDELNIQFEVFEDEDGVFIFPKGATEMDDALVSEPLEWLKDYPVAHKAFVKALKAYSDASEDDASDVADLFRKSLETFFQEFFNTPKTLENLKSEYGTYMKSKGVPTEISGNFETLLQAYANFINSYAKHRDETSDTVLEYIMYQTGNIIRLLMTLKGATN